MPSTRRSRTAIPASGWRLIGELRDAIDLGELVVHYQPIVDLATRIVTEAEALVRWQHPGADCSRPASSCRSPSSPASCAGSPITMLEAALAHAARWRSEEATSASPSTSRRRPCSRIGWSRRGDRALERWETPPARLRIEITEDALLVDQERRSRVVRCLGDAGVGVSLDDFGTGYSSLALLKQLAVDELKIDRSFVDNALQDTADAAIVQERSLGSPDSSGLTARGGRGRRG